MTFVFEVLGVISAAALIRALSARSGTASLRGWLACVAVGFAALAFWTDVFPEARTLVRLHSRDGRLTSAEGRALPGQRFDADEQFLAWADSRLPRFVHVFLDCPQPQPCTNVLANWITYRLTPRVFTDFRSEAQWVLFYRTASPRAPGIVHFAPGYGLERLPR